MRLICQFGPFPSDSVVDSIVVAPNVAYVGSLVVGGDNSGVHASSDRGETWAPANTAASGYQPDTANIKFSSLAWSQTTNGVVYGLTGNGAAAQGGLVRATDGGHTWSRLTSAFVGRGNNLVDDSTPRAIGHLIGLDEANDAIYVGTTTGVWKYKPSNGTATPISTTPSLAADTIGNLVIDPNNTGNSAILWATVPVDLNGTGHQGLWKLSYNGTSWSATAVTGEPVRPWQLVAVNANGTTAVWVAGDNAGSGNQGVFRCAGLGTSCVDRTGSIPTTNYIWTSVDGYYSGGVEHVYVGAFKNPGSPTDPSAWVSPLWRIDYTSPTSITRTALPAGDSNVKNTIGASTTVWWLVKPTVDLPSPVPPNASHRENRFGGGGYRVGQVMVEPTANGVNLFVAGRAGAWRSSNGGADWYPIVNGLSNTSDRRVAASPLTASKLVDADVDWSALWSTTNLTGGQPVESEPTNKKPFYSLVYDNDGTSNGTAYAGLGNRDDDSIDGDIFKNADPFGTSSSWMHLNNPNGSTHRVIGLAISSVSTGSTRRLIAVLDHDNTTGGLYYTDNGGTNWTHPTETRLPGGFYIGEKTPNKRVDIVWKPRMRKQWLLGVPV
ncbi:MAG TPA: hypothetical protein VGJ25_13100 [Gaiellaceae bacterium]